MDSVWEANEGARIKQIAALAYRRVAQGERTPAWRRWTDSTGRSMLAVLQGRDIAGHLERNPVELDAAIVALRNAIADEPENVVLRQTLGQLEERAERLLTALEIALGLVAQWPALVAPRYRLGVLYSFIDAWWPQYVLAGPGGRSRVNALMRLVEGDSGELPFDGLPVEVLSRSRRPTWPKGGLTHCRVGMQRCANALLSKGAASEFDPLPGVIGGSPTAPRAAATLVVESADLSVQLLEYGIATAPAVALLQNMVKRTRSSWQTATQTSKCTTTPPASSGT